MESNNGHNTELESKTFAYTVHYFLPPISNGPEQAGSRG
ncbi:hypothetical protein GWI33_014603, partial [Rhynchophorus ferrugineus]